MNAEKILTGLKEVMKGNIDEIAIRSFLIALSGRIGIDVLYQAGRRYGKLLGYKNKVDSIGDVLETLKEYFSSEVIFIPEEKKLCVLVKRTHSSGDFTNLGMKVCHFEAGVISGAFSYFLKRPVGAIERKCRAEGNEYCEFEVIL